MWIRTTQAVMLSGLIGLAASQGAVAQPTAVSKTDARQSGATTPLGDLSGFRAIAADTLKIVGTGDFAAAKKRIKDLELSWDQAETKLKPLALEKWQTVDVAIDRALKEVRAWRTTPAASGATLQALIATIDAMK